MHDARPKRTTARSMLSPNHARFIPFIPGHRYTADHPLWVGAGDDARHPSRNHIFLGGSPGFGKPGKAPGSPIPVGLHESTQHRYGRTLRVDAPSSGPRVPSPPFGISRNGLSLCGAVQKTGVSYPHRCVVSNRRVAPISLRRSSCFLWKRPTGSTDPVR